MIWRKKGMKQSWNSSIGRCRTASVIWNDSYHHRGICLCQSDYLNCWSVCGSQVHELVQFFQHMQIHPGTADKEFAFILLISISHPATGFTRLSVWDVMSLQLYSKQLMGSQWPMTIKRRWCTLTNTTVATVVYQLLSSFINSRTTVSRR